LGARVKVEDKGPLKWLGNGTTREAYGTPHSTVMSDPIDALAYTLLPFLLSIRQVPPSGRLCPLLVGRPHLSGGWGGGSGMES
jgi:hypothetical protein